jgi:D-methionine transport system permease protein
MLNEILLATGQTLYMVFASVFIAIIIGLPLGTLLFTTKSITPRPKLYQTLSAIINAARSIPFIILLVAIIPFTRLIIGTSIGVNAAVVPLSIGAIFFFARLVENLYQELPEGLIETGHIMGATTWQMITKILIPESISALINATTVTAITLINYSAMAGTVGGGGLGDLAIRYGYQRFNLEVMITTIIVLIVMVQLVQMIGDKLAIKYSH